MTISELEELVKEARRERRRDSRLVDVARITVSEGDD